MARWSAAAAKCVFQISSSSTTEGTLKTAVCQVSPQPASLPRPPDRPYRTRPGGPAGRSPAVDDTTTARRPPPTYRREAQPGRRAAGPAVVAFSRPRPRSNPRRTSMFAQGIEPWLLASDHRERGQQHQSPDFEALIEHATHRGELMGDPVDVCDPGGVRQWRLRRSLRDWDRFCFRLRRADFVVESWCSACSRFFRRRDIPAMPPTTRMTARTEKMIT